MSDSWPPDDRPGWPERDLQSREPSGPADESPAEDEPQAEAPIEGPPEPGAGEPETDGPGPGEPTDVPPDEAEEEPETEATPVTTVFASAADDGWDPKRDGERRLPTTAEQAVPWLIGIILALAGMVIILVALIFSDANSLVGSVSPTPSPAQSTAPTATPSVSEAETPAASPTAEPTEVVTPTPVPTYGPLEMLYLGRQPTTAPIYLLRRDFSSAGDATVVAQTAAGVEKYAWSPDGRQGVVVINGQALALVPGENGRPLADNISAVAFGWDSDTVFAIRIVADGANDRADILAIDFASGEERILTGITYPRPVIGADPALKEAQFIDNGGLVRLYATNDGNVVAWILGAPATYRVDPVDGRLIEVDGEPLLWSPDGRQHITVAENANGTSVLANTNRAGEVVASVTVTGLVSHIRWAPTRNEIVFTLGISPGGGIRQNLYVWDLVDGNAPLALTSNGAAFGAEWLGVAQSWQP